MIKCPKCGLNIDDDSVTCPYCGAFLEDYKDDTPIEADIVKETVVETEKDPFEEYSKQEEEKKPVDNSNANIGWFFLGFIVSPIVALVIFITQRRRKPKLAQLCLNGAIAGFILMAVLYTAYFVLIIALAASGKSITDIFPFLKEFMDSTTEAIKILK